MPSATDRDYLVALALAPGVGPRRLDLVLRCFGEARKAWEAPEEVVAAVPGLPRKVARDLCSWRGRVDPGTLRRRMAEAGLWTVTSVDGDWPPGLLSVAERPVVLCGRGDPACLRRSAVAVVGTRRPTPYGLEMTASIAGGLASAGMSIVSGLALGVDGAAHRAALAAGGVTVAVLGSGHEHLYPRAHRGLAEEIARAGGAVISQFAPDTLPLKGNFIARNRVVAGLALGVVVTEAPAGSGALSTAAFARDYGRPVMVVPGPVSTEAAGCLELLRSGAAAVGGAEHVLETLGCGGGMGPLFQGRPGGFTAQATEAGPGALDSLTVLNSDQRKVLRALRPGETLPFDRLLERSGLRAERLGTALGRLEVQGLICRRPAGYCLARGESGAGMRPTGGRRT